MEDDTILKVVGCIVMVLLGLGFIAVAPFINLWAVYTIWDMDEAARSYDFYHWLAAFLLSGMLGGIIGGSSKAFKK